MRNAFALALAILCASAAHAQSPSGHHYYGSAGASFQGAQGFELALGLQADLGDRLYLRVSPLNLVTTQAKGFYRDTFSNGQSRCRNAANGRFATDESCSGLDYRIDADAYLRLTPQLLIGGGAIHTVSSDYTPERAGQTEGFFAAMVEWDKNYGFEMRGGPDNAAIRLRAAF